MAVVHINAGGIGYGQAVCRNVSHLADVNSFIGEIECASGFGCDLEVHGLSCPVSLAYRRLPCGSFGPEPPGLVRAGFML